MATYVVLITKTQKGESNIKDSTARAAAFHEEAQRFGAEVKEIYWTLGQYDGIVLLEAPDDETAAALLHRLSSKGSVRTQAMRGFSAEEMQTILQRAEGNGG